MISRNKLAGSNSTALQANPLIEQVVGATVVRVEIKTGLVYVNEAGVKVSSKLYENVSAQAGRVEAARTTAAAKRRADTFKGDLRYSQS